MPLIGTLSDLLRSDSIILGIAFNFKQILRELKDVHFVYTTQLYSMIIWACTNKAKPK